MAKANIFIIIMLILSLNLILFAGGVRVIGDEGDNFLNEYIDTDSYDSSNTVIVQEDLKDTLPTTFQESGSGGIFSFIDTLGAVKKFIKFVINIIFTPIGLFVELPATITLLVGVPLLIAGILSVVFFIRSG